MALHYVLLLRIFVKEILEADDRQVYTKFQLKHFCTLELAPPTIIIMLGSFTTRAACCAGCSFAKAFSAYG